MILPITLTLDRMPANIGKGGVFLITRKQDEFEARFLATVTRAPRKLGPH